MKKIMIVALMAAAASTAFAGDSDGLKQILKAKTYEDAENLVKANLNSLENNEEKAKAYNKLVELSLKPAEKIVSDIQLNQLAGKQEPYDSVALFTNLGRAFDAANECEKYDQMPNEKGKIKPRFHKSNAEKLYGLRPYLIEAGIYYQKKEDNANAYRFLKGYVDSSIDPLFAEQDKSNDPNLTNIAYYASIFAYQAGDVAAVDKYADIAMKDPEKKADAMNVKLAMAQQGLKNRADSVAYMQKLEGIYANDKNNDMVFGSLVNIYSGLKEDAKLEQLFNEKLAADPNNFTVWAVKGQNAMIAQDLENAVDYFKKALNVQPENTQILTYLGACLLDRASQAEDRAAGKTGRVAPAALEQIMPIYEESRSYLEKAKQLDPGRSNANWAYPLYRCYYRIYGDNDARTKEAEALTK